MKELCGTIDVEFDTGNKSSYKIFRETVFINSTKTINIPNRATKVVITSNSNIKSFGCMILNPAIVSIEHFESNCLTDLSYAFNGFTNVREFKHFDVTSKVTDASYMCCGWENFNGTIPENFCSIFENLENTEFMFRGWHVYNQPLLEGFCTNTEKLLSAG